MYMPYEGVLFRGKVTYNDNDNDNENFLFNISIDQEFPTFLCLFPKILLDDTRIPPFPLPPSINWTKS